MKIERQKKERDFGFRFRGKESFNYLRYFPVLIQMLMDKVNKKAFYRLSQIFSQSISLRKLVSYSVRIIDVSGKEIEEMTLAGADLFKSCALFDSKISPSMFCFTQIAPKHAECLLNTTGFGLGINTMEGHEQKHQQIGKYFVNTRVQEKWNYIFRHEFIQLVYLRENGFDSIRYRKRNTKYLPNVEELHCVTCSLKLNSFDKCDLCDSDEMKKIYEQISTV